MTRTYHFSERDEIPDAAAGYMLTIAGSVAWGGMKVGKRVPWRRE